MGLAPVRLAKEPEMLVTRRYFPCCIGGAVVEDDVFEIRVSLSKDGLDTTGEKISLVP